MIVLDNSVIVPAFIESATSEMARRAMTMDNWVLPPLWEFEFTSAMATLVSAREIDSSTAHRAMALAKTAVINREVPVDQGQVLRLAVRLKISAYDAQYVSLADEYGALCVSNDRKLCIRSAGRVIPLSDFVSQP